MSRGSAWAARHDRGFASAEELQQRRLPEWEDKRAQRRAEFGGRIAAIAAQVASEVSAAVAAEVSAAVAAALQAARTGHHEYLDLEPATTSTPTASVADDNASFPDASMVVSARRSASASAQQQQQQEDAAPRQAIENIVALPATSGCSAVVHTTCSTRCPSRAVTLSVSATAPATTSVSSKVTVYVVSELCCLDLEPFDVVELVTTPPKCSTEGLNDDPLVMPEQQDHSKEYENSVQDANIPCLLHVIHVGEFPASVNRQLLCCGLPKFVTALICLPLLPCDGKYMWLPPDSLYGQKSKSKFLKHDMSGCFLLGQRGNSSDMIHVHEVHAIDALFVIGNLSAQQYLGQWRVFKSQKRPHKVVLVADQPISDMNYKLLKRSWDVGYWSFGCSRFYLLIGGWAKWSRTNGIDTSSKLLVTAHVVTAGLFACIRYSSEELLTLSWNPGQQAISGPRYLASIELPAATCVRPRSCSWTSVEKAWSPPVRHVPGHHYMWLMIWRITEARPITACLAILQTTEFSSIELSSWKISGFSISVSILADYSYACFVPDNTYLQSMADCYSVEMVSCKSSNASASYLMVWKIAWVFCSVCTNEACSFHCPVFTKSTHWSVMAQVNALFSIVIPWVLTFQALQLTMDPGDSLSIPVAYVIVRNGVWTVKCFCQDICMELPLYQFSYVGPFYQQHTEHHFTLASIYPVMGAEQVATENRLFGSFGHVQGIFQPHHLEASEYLSPARNSVIDRISSFLLGYLLQCCVLVPVIVAHIAPLLKLASSDGSPIYMQVRVHELVIDGFLQDWILSCFLGYMFRCGFEPIQWKIAWSLNWECSGITRWDSKELLLQNVVYQILSASFVVICYGICGVASWYLLSTRLKRTTVHSAALHKRRCRDPCFRVFLVVPRALQQTWDPVSCEGTPSTVPFQFLAYVAIWSCRSLEFCQGMFSWDPGIWALLCLFGLLTQAETWRRNIADPAYYRIHCLDHAYYFNQVHVNQHYYLDDFCDQVNISDDYFLEQVGIICYINLAKFRLNYGTHHDLGEVMKHQVPWDPGASSWHRLEVKPNFKEWGMLATWASLGS